MPRPGPNKKNYKKPKKIVEGENKQMPQKKFGKNARKRNQRKAMLLGNGYPEAKKGSLPSISYAQSKAMSDQFRAGAFKDVKDYKKWASWVANVKAKGPDLRPDSNNFVWGGLHVNNTNSNSKIICTANAEVATGIACAILSHAFLHGYRSNAETNNTPDYPQFAFQFIYFTVIQVMEGNTDQVPKILFPDYLLEILAAVNPKSGPQIGAGTVGYSWKVNNQSTPVSLFYYPQYDTAGRYLIGNAGLTTSDGFNVMVPSTTSYTVELGKKAFSDLNNYINKRLNIPRGGYNPYELRDFSLKDTLMEREVSAFSSSNLVIGGGVSGGFAYSLAGLETYVSHPKFACFVDPTVKLNRGFREYKATGGDVNWLVCSLLHQFISTEVSNPNYPAFKPIDFYEICDRLALAIVAMFNNYYRDTTVQNRIPNLGISASHFLVLMRKVILGQYANTQYGVQSMRFYTDKSTDEFYPLLVSSNTSTSVTPTSLTLPLFAVENLNSLKGRSTWFTVNPVTKRIIKRDPKFFVPVVGVYQKGVFDTKIYNYSDGGEGLISIFTSPGASVNIIDGSIGSDYVDLDASPIISEDAEVYNNSMIYLSPYIQCPTLLTGDGGINVLTVIGDTHLVREVFNNGDKEKKSKKITVAEKKYVSKLSMQYPIADVDNIKKTFVCPEYKLQDLNAAVGSIASDTMRILNLEMFLENYGVNISGNSSGGLFVDAKTLRQQWVDACVKAKDASDSLIVQQIKALSEAGRAGLLGSLASMFGNVMTPVVASVLDSYIPI